MASQRMVYIAGKGYSGSTLLSFVMNTHPDLVSIGEVTGPIDSVDAPTYPCSCGEQLSSCEFWRRVANGMRAKGHEFGPNQWDLRFVLGRHPLSRRLLSRPLGSPIVEGFRDRTVRRVRQLRERLDALARRNLAFANTVREVTGTSILVDASKDPARAVFLHQLPDIELYVIHLVRDSPGAVSSHMRNREASLLSGVNSWNRNAFLMQNVLKQIPADRALRVRYEDICQAPDEELARIADFLSIGHFPRPVRFRSAEHHILGNRMRLETSDEIELDQKWRDRLSGMQVGAIRLLTHHFRRHFGYA